MPRVPGQPRKVLDPQVLIGISLFLTLLFVAIGVWQQRIGQLHRKKVISDIREARERGTDRAIAQHPQIDTQSCIGCASCIRACPEHGVLGLVDGVAHIIHGSRCIGHGKCAVACPVEAITVGLGDVSTRTDIPILSDANETSVPGIFIAGELGGMALIRVAIEQGIHTVEQIARRLSGPGRRSAKGGVPDVLIVGSGPAGLAATLKAVELGLSYVTIDQDEIGGTVRKYPRRKLTMTQPVQLPLYGRMKKHNYIKEELVELWDGIVRKYDLRIHTRVKLLGLERASGNGLVARTSGGEIGARTMVLALGRRGTPRKLGVPGEDAEKVLYQLIDTASYRSRHLLVVGGGDSAIEAATGLANQTGNVVTLSYRKANFFRLKARNEERIAEYQASGKLRVVFSSAVESIEADRVTIKSGEDGAERRETIENDFVFVFAGGEPPYPLLKGMGIRFGGEDAAGTRARSKMVEA